MELDKIEKLLEKYFEASTTVAEEEMLRAYFSQDKVPTHLKQYAPLFQYFSNAKKERFTKSVPLEPRKSHYKWISVAAVAVLTFGIYFGADRYRDYQEQKEAEFAYRETRKALNLLAENFGRGTEKIAYLNQFEEAKEKIYNNN